MLLLSSADFFQNLLPPIRSDLSPNSLQRLSAADDESHRYQGKIQCWFVCSSTCFHLPYVFFFRNKSCIQYHGGIDFLMKAIKKHQRSLLLNMPFGNLSKTSLTHVITGRTDVNSLIASCWCPLQIRPPDLNPICMKL